MPFGQILLLHVNRRHEHFEMPKLRLLAPPAVHQTPWGVANNTAPRYVVSAIKRMFRPSDAAAAVFRVAARDQENIVNPRPDHAALNVFAFLYFVPDVDERLDIVIAIAGVEPHLARIAPKISLKNAEAFIPNDGHLHTFAFLHACERDWIVHGVEFERGALPGACGSGVVVLFHKLMCGFEVRAPGTFIADGPNNHARMGTVAVQNFGSALNESR